MRLTNTNVSKYYACERTMKSIICLISSNYGLISLIYVILAYTPSVTTSPPCGLYGAPPCQFVPAPPGQTPSCARPGKTYCEHVDNYPTYLIHHLVHKWGYEAKNLIVDETWEDFATVAWRDTPVFYDPAFIFPQRQYGNNANGYGKGSYGDFSGYNYETPPPEGISAARPLPNNIGKYAEDAFYISKHQQRTTQPPTYLLYSSASQRLNFNRNQVSPYNGSLKVTPNNPTLWLKRIARDLQHKRLGFTTTTTRSFTTANHTLASAALSSATKAPAAAAAAAASSSLPSRVVSLNMDLLDIVGVDKGAQSRVKRQSAGRNSLCQTTSQFITPQAALNSKGNWMFVVNEASTARQQVKAELCASNTCSNLCQLPLGYNSRCEQKFVQKRLIALQANGQNLYTDTFWFPSCCVCTISAN